MVEPALQRGRDRHAGTGRQQAGETDRGQWGGRSAQAHPSCHPPPSPPTASRPADPSSRSLLLALCLDHYSQRPRPPSLLLPLAPLLTLAGSPPARPAPALPLPSLQPLSSLTSQPSLRLCPSLWPSQICLALNLAPTAWPAQQTPGLAYLAPKQPPAFICRPRASQKPPDPPRTLQEGSHSCPSPTCCPALGPCHLHQRPHPSDTPSPWICLPHQTAPQTPLPLGSASP